MFFPALMIILGIMIGFNLITTQDVKRELDLNMIAILVFSLAIGQAIIKTNAGNMVSLAMIDLLEKHFEPATAMRRLNRFFSYYASNFKFGHTLYARICRAQTPADARNILLHFYKEAPETVNTPKITLLR